MRTRIATFLALSTVLTGQALGAPALLSTQSAVEGALLSIQAPSPDELEQRAREAQEKVEWNRRCRPASEKSYAAAIDACRKAVNQEEISERKKCFAEAREQYFKSLSKCSG
jgi:hypothetical protein